MDNKEYTRSVQSENYPDHYLVPIDEPFVDDRGKIQNLLNTPIQGVAIITSKAGSVRSNHWHKTDWHYLYVISGSMEYYERPLESSTETKPALVTAGQMVFTPPEAVHKTVFLEDTVMMSFSKRNRDHVSHESDVVREEF